MKKKRPPLVYAIQEKKVEPKLRERREAWRVYLTQAELEALKAKSLKSAMSVSGFMRCAVLDIINPVSNTKEMTAGSAGMADGFHA